MLGMFPTLYTFVDICLIAQLSHLHPFQFLLINVYNVIIALLINVYKHNLQIITNNFK